VPALARAPLSVLPDVDSPPARGEDTGLRPVDWAIALGLAGVALALDLFRLGSTSLFADEVFSVQLVNNPWPAFWNYLWGHEPNMILYHLLLRGWLWFTSHLGLAPNELVVRAPSVLFAVLAVLVVFALGRRFWGTTVGAIGAALYLVNHVQLSVVREARSYPLQMLLLCVAWYALLTALSTDRRRRRWWAGYAIAMTLALYAHLFSALVLAAQVVAVVVLLLIRSDWHDRARRSWREMAISVAAICLAAVPLVPVVVLHGSTNAWVPPANLVAFARFLWNISGHVVVYGLLLGATLALALILQRGRKIVAPTAALFCWLIVPIVLAYALTQPRLNLHLFVWGYLVVVVPPLCILAAIGVTLLPWRRARPVLALGLIGSALLALPIHYALPGQDYRTAIRWIEQHYQDGDGLICTSWSCSLALDYYLRADGGPTQLTAGSLGSWSWDEHQVRPLDPQQVPVYAAAHRRIFFVDPLTKDEPADQKTRARMAQDWLDRHDEWRGEISVAGPVTVALYEAR
jgi:mannosyltransferase